MILFAVHISDGVLTMPWLAAGFALAALLLGLSALRVREDEVPRIAILTAAFFVSSLIHVRVGPTSMHLLLTGLVGVVLGLRAPLAIFVGLLMQAALIGHGGYSTLGVNTCVMTLPALFCYGVFRAVHHINWIKSPIGRGLLVGIGAVVLFLSGVYGLTLMLNTPLTSIEVSAIDLANARMLDPAFLGAAFLFAGIAVIVERQFENTPEFPLGFLIGELSVLLTVALNGIVLLMGGEQNSPMMVLGLMLAHLPIAVIEGVILGVVVGFLVRVKPEMLGMAKPVIDA
ncbi:MAG TPA: CbiM family transporter [Gemmataceae bacterium]|nr:CbiM family transporter [Gemmataceae bacterium]